MAKDIQDLIELLTGHGVDFIIVGAFAMAHFGYVRATGDIDVFVLPSRENAEKLVSALRAFGAPLEAHGVKESDFSVPGIAYQLGLPPNRIDLLTEISGLDFAEACRDLEVGEVFGSPVKFLSLPNLIRNKKAAGRGKDLIDLQALERLAQKRAGKGK